MSNELIESVARAIDAVDHRKATSLDDLTRQIARAAADVVLEHVAEMLERCDMNSAGYMAGEVRALMGEQA